MSFVSPQKLRQLYRTKGANGTCQHIAESLQATRRGEIGHLKPSDFSIRELAEGLVENGAEWVRSMDPKYGGGQSVMESSDGVDSTAFANITGQLLINAVMEGYENEAFMISRAMRTVSTRLNGEIVPGIGKLGDKTESVGEGMPYPRAGISEDYITTPQTDKKGVIVPVTKEAIFFDRTGLILERANGVGESLGLNKEKRCVDVLIGATNNHKWKGTSYNTYQASTPWINILSGATYDLQDWNEIDDADQLFNDITDPNTGEPVVMMANTIIATPAKRQVVNRILNATEVRHTTNSGNTQTLAGNPFGSGLTSVVSRYLYSRLKSQLSLSAANAKATWFYGDISKAFRYMENWPITVTQAPQNSEAEFDRDIVVQFKASERGVAAVWNPRCIAKISGHA